MIKVKHVKNAMDLQRLDLPGHLDPLGNLGALVFQAQREIVVFQVKKEGPVSWALRGFRVSKELQGRRVIQQEAVVNKVEKEIKVTQASLEISEYQEEVEFPGKKARKDTKELRVTPCDIRDWVRRVLLVPQEAVVAQDPWGSRDNLGLVLQVHVVPKVTVENLA